MDKPKKHYTIIDHQNNLQFQPYLKEHVPRYCQWMQDPQLLDYTGSEPLTLEQELENQHSWITDPTKYTFLVFHRAGPNLTMIGDINLFFSEWIEPNQAQINIMIAQKSYRGRGLASPILNMIELFAEALYCKNEIIAKIKHGNEPSMRLFKKHKYEEVKYVQAFQEHQLRKKLNTGITWADFCNRYSVKETNV